MVGACGRKRWAWTRAVWAGWYVDVISVYGVDGVSVRGMGNVPGVCVGVDNVVGFYFKI